MSVNWEVIPSVKGKKEPSIYRNAKQLGHKTIGGKGKVAKALEKKK